MPNCNEKIVCLTTEHKSTVVRKFSIIIQKIFFCLLMLCLGFILGELRYATRHQIDDSNLCDTKCEQKDDCHQFVYLFDTKQKIEDFYRDELELYPENSFTRLSIDTMRRHERPLVRVGPFFIFASNDNCKFSVREQSSPQSLVSLENREQTKRISFSSLLENEWKEPRFRANFTYSKDGVYERGNFCVARKDGMTERVYFDDKGRGVFDGMHIFDSAYVFTKYRLNDLTWESLGEIQPPLPQWPGAMPPPGGLPNP